MSSPDVPFCLVCCDCGWRQPATSRIAGLERLVTHEKNLHKGEYHARKAYAYEVEKRKQKSKPAGTRRPKTRAR